MSNYHDVIQLIGSCVDAAGVLIMIIGALAATAHFLGQRHAGFAPAYRGYREGLGRAILLGLEFLVAGDIIRTVAVAPTMDNVLILGMIVLIRTFLSMSLQLEVEGRLPWQPASARPPE